jgi:hypothetical protein
MKVCVDCQKGVAGRKAVKVREDKTIRALRKIKRTLRIAKGNELYVCEDCLDKHLERRKSFEKTMLIFSAVAALIIVLLLVTILFSGRFEIWTVLSAIFIGVFLFLFSVIFKYVPAVESVTLQQIPGKRKKKGGK